MNTTYTNQPIQCGDHPLDARIIFRNIEHRRAIEGETMRFAEPPDIIIQCETCGRESHTDRFTLDNTYVDRVWP